MNFDLEKIFSNDDTELHIKKLARESKEDAKLRRLKDKLLFTILLFCMATC